MRAQPSLAALLAGAAAAAGAGAGACGKREPAEEAPLPVPVAGSGAGAVAGSGAGSGADAAGAGAGSAAAPADPWPELAGLPRAEPARVVALPAKPDVPRFSLGGPVLVGELAVVASSQFGFLGVDWRRGAIAWSRPAGLYVAPPAPVADGVALVGDCFAPPDLAALGGQRLLGCLRVVSPGGADVAYLPIRGAPAAVEPFAAAPGAQALWADGDRKLRWRRGDRAVSVDLLTGAAVPAPAEPAPLAIAYRGKRWEIALDAEGRVVARHPAEPGRAGRPARPARPAWRSDTSYTALAGAVWLPDSAPMLRLATLGGRGGRTGIRVTDMDATGSLATASARPMPGVALLAAAASSVGDTALAIRLDTSLRRDFIAGYAANAMIMWVYPLPIQLRADPVGVAVAPDAVLVFHDGDTLAVLPELSAPPTAPGAVRAPSENATP